MKNILKKIKPNEFYTPNELVKIGVMKAPNTDSQKQMILRFIRAGRIKALNLGSDKKARYVILGKDLIKFIKKYHG